MEIDGNALTTQEVRKLVSAYFAVTSQRNLLAGQAVATESELDRVLDAWAATVPAANWARSIAGIAPAMAAGMKFPPVIVLYDGADYWLADGFHRVTAAEQAGLEEIACELHPGTRQEAQCYSFSANKANGLRRTNDDKGRAVQAALLHPLSAGLSDRQIAQHVGVDHTTVLRWREKLSAFGALHQMGT